MALVAERVVQTLPKSLEKDRRGTKAPAESSSPAIARANPNRAGATAPSVRAVITRMRPCAPPCAGEQPRTQLRVKLIAQDQIATETVALESRPPGAAVHSRPSGWPKGNRTTASRPTPPTVISMVIGPALRRDIDHQRRQHRSTCAPIQLPRKPLNTPASANTATNRREQDQNMFGKRSWCHGNNTHTSSSAFRFAANLTRASV